MANPFGEALLVHSTRLFLKREAKRCHNWRKLETLLARISSMFDHLLAPLRDTLRPHFNLRKTRLEAMAAIMLGLVNCRTVNLTHLAAHLPGKALYKSKYRRLQHFLKRFVSISRLLPVSSCVCLIRREQNISLWTGPIGNSGKSTLIFWFWHLLHANSEFL